MIDFATHQHKALSNLQNGSILCGGVGSGKSRTSLAYYYTACDGVPRIVGNEDTWLPMREALHLYIITTAKKRDNSEWLLEAAPFLITTNPCIHGGMTTITIDSWNNIKKYKHVKNAFFIFDEQKVCGYGVWTKSFLHIVKSNKWILLSATPGDNWMDYIPVFIANGFYKNKTDFINRHVVFSTYTKFPKVERYFEVGRLIKLRDQILVTMKHQRKAYTHHKSIITEYSRDLYDTVVKKRWNPYDGLPIQNSAVYCYTMRKVVNSDASRIIAVADLLMKHPRAIIFYNFNYELDILLKFAEDAEYPVAQWNGHKHEDIPDMDRWIYLVQYTAGAEGWNCIQTDTTIFFSQNYSYKVLIQSAGRIDRLNTPFEDLYYYHLRSSASIDLAILKALREKKTFNESSFVKL